MVEIMIGSGAKRKTLKVLLSDDTIRRRINNMAVNVCQQVCSDAKQSTLQASIQLDESTDSALEFRKPLDRFCLIRGRQKYERRVFV